MSDPVFVYGAGGFAREVAWILDSSSDAALNVIGFVDDSDAQPENWPDSRPVLSFEQARKIDATAGFVVAVGNPVVKRQIAERLDQAGCLCPVISHSELKISPRVLIGDGSILCAGSNITVDIKIGRHVQINLNCTIGHDVNIEDFVTLSPGVHVSGNVTIGAGAFVGTGVCILNGQVDDPLILGEGCVIAAGSCVTKSTDPYTMYAGVPAIAKKVLK